MKLLYKMMGISRKDLFNSSNWCENCTRSFYYGSMFRKVEGCCFENSKRGLIVMTHEELLVKIDVCFSEIPVDYGQADAHKALRAVVELHKPEQRCYDATCYCKNFCSGCYEEESGFSDYPCPTIQAIEKALV